MPVASLPLSDQMIELVSRRFRMLGEPQRLRILQTLEAGERSVTEVTAALDTSQSNISKHLQALNDAGLVGRKRKGNSILYFIADPMIFKLCELVCRGAAQDAQQKLSVLETSALSRFPQE